jgi:hypothetical protein
VRGQAELSQTRPQPGCRRQPGWNHHQRAAVSDQLAIEIEPANLVEHHSVMLRVATEDDFSELNGDAAPLKRLAKFRVHGPCKPAMALGGPQDASVFGHRDIKKLVDVGKVSPEIGQRPSGDEDQSKT